MFITRRTPIFFDADDGAGAGATVAPEADPSMGAPSPDEQTFETPGDYRSARSQFLQSAPPIIDVNEPAPAAPEVDPIDAAVADLATPPAAPVAPGATAPVAPPATPSAYAGRESEVEQALGVMDALRTEQGVRAMVAQGLAALGYSREQIAALSGQAPVPGAPESAPAAPGAPDPLANIADDDLITGADLKGIVAKLVSDAVTQTTAATTAALQEQVDPVRQAFEQQQQRTAQQTADATYVELLGPTPPEGDPNRDAWLRQAKQVQILATAHLAPDNWNPADIRAALLRGHAQFVSDQDALLRAYAGAKKRDREANPTNIGGGTPTGGEAVKEPQNLAEARAAAKSEGFFK